MGSAVPQPSAELETPFLPPVKLDRNLRRALLKALTDLEADDPTDDEAVESATSGDILREVKKVEEAKYVLKGFNQEEIPSEDKLQNSSFVEQERLVASDSTAVTVEPVTVIERLNDNEAEVVNIKAITSSSDEKLETTTIAAESTESLKSSASNGIALANALASPKPTVASPLPELFATKNPTTTTTTTTTTTGTATGKKLETAEEVKIFQAPLVAAFTVQQDELGIPKSVVPIYRPTGDGKALTLQEQLEFKQQLLEKQLADLQQQQQQQTHFLLRQQQLYEQQLRQKQYYLQEQNRIKAEEQARLNKQIEAQRLQKQIEEQRIYQQRLQQFQQKQQFTADQTNNVLTFQSPVKGPGLQSTHVHLQPSLTLQLPSAAPPLSFINNNNNQQFAAHQEQFRLQHIRQQQQQQHQRLQQSFPTAFQTEFQPPVISSATRFNRQEAFNSVGNFGVNEATIAKQQIKQPAFTQFPPLPARNNNHNNGQSNNFLFNPYSNNQQFQGSVSVMRLYIQ